MASMAKGSKAKKVSRTSPSAAPRAAAGKPKRASISAAKRATGKRAEAKKTGRTAKDGKSARAAKSNSRSAQGRQRPKAPGKPIGLNKDVVVGKPAAGARRQPLSAEARKKLAGEHLRALLEEKKRRAAQTPAWRTIDHHDHSPRPPEPMPPGAVSESDLDRGLGDQDQS